ncbi:hypothetical protein [Pseudoruegeria sp. HB172150]|uniref:hypothetical protein n=1 Tax=Pseudoruegeria sp. HB172150 TaxID=2721164 RepID=UPI0015567F7E|nr:hypothetical protein [Pseudoruegeria sp. HB172150]
MNSLAKYTALVAMVMGFTPSASTAEIKYSCMYLDSNGQMTRERINGSVEYSDTGLFEDYVKRGGSESAPTKTFFIINGQNKDIGDIRLRLYDEENELILAAQKTQTSLEVRSEYNTVKPTPSSMSLGTRSIKSTFRYGGGRTYIKKAWIKEPCLTLVPIEMASSQPEAKPWEQKRYTTGSVLHFRRRF